MAKSADKVTEKWASGMANASQSYIDGVNGVTVAPGEAAANAAERMLANLQEAVASGRYQKAARSVSLQDWQRAAATKGATRLGTGAQQAKPKMQAFMSKFLPYLDQNASSLPPRGDREQNKMRMLRQFEINSNFRNQE